MNDRTQPRLCKGGCGNPVPPMKAAGRPREWCSDSCRVSSYRSLAQPRSNRCAGCQRLISSSRRRWCQDCAIEHSTALRRSKPKVECSIDGCRLVVVRGGLCWMHVEESRKVVGDLCSVDGCDRGRFFRGMCGKHATAASKVEHGRKTQSYEITCEQCGEVAMVRKRIGGRFCSNECWHRFQFGSPRWRSARHALTLAAKGITNRRRSGWVVGSDGQVMTKEQARPRGTWCAGWCARCGSPFVNTDPRQVASARYCSHECSNQGDGAARNRRKKRQTAAFVEPVWRRRIFERDGWRCQICGKKVNRNKTAPHPRAPTIDHIIPLAAGVAAGGTHEPKNVQCAHFRCNVLKGDRAANEQLLLFG